LDNPARLVLDLAGVKVHPAFDNHVKENQAVTRIRFRQVDPENLRLVFDLEKLVGFQIIRDPQKENQITVVFNYLVQEINFLANNPETKVVIKTNFPAKYTVANYSNPSRLVLDFRGATLGEKIVPLPGDGKWITNVRLSQFDPDTVRIVLDLVDTAPCFVVPSRENPNWLEIRQIQTITGIGFSSGDGGDKLTIQSTGGLFETIMKQKKPERLQVDLDYARLAPSLTVPPVSDGQVKGIHFAPLSETKVRIEVQLAFFTGFTAKFSSDRRQLDIIFKRSPLIGKTIVLDPGHGGVDSGAIGRQGTREKDVVLEVGLMLKDLLEEAGARVIMTRTDDSFVSLYERSYLANYLLADLFISIHANSNDDSSMQGIEVYHLDGHDEAKSLAQSVMGGLVESTGLNNGGVKQNDFVVIRETQMPSILVELGYLSNYQEESVIDTNEFRQKAAAGLLKGIVSYYTN
jgi:N-acetylmuramoyl-L-alanine amidase